MKSLFRLWFHMKRNFKTGFLEERWMILVVICEMILFLVYLLYG